MLARGKGNKIIGITGKGAAREEFMTGALVVTPGDTLRIFSGKRYLNLNFNELEHYRGERGRRGNKLPRGFQKVDGISLIND